MTSSEPTAAVARRPGRPRSETGERGEVAQRLLDAATELAVEQGFDACGLREIAARADVSSGMIAYYFGDRQGLYEAMFQRAIDRVSNQVTILLGDEQRHWHDRLDELVRIHIEAIAADPWLPKLIISEVLAKKESSIKKKIAGHIGQGPMQLMIGWIEEEQSRGILRANLDARLLAMTIASLAVFPFLMLPILGDEIGISLDDGFPARLIEHSQRLLAHGIRARTENP